MARQVMNRCVGTLYLGSFKLAATSSSVIAA